MIFITVYCVVMWLALILLREPIVRCSAPRAKARR
jgi:hypothetical protein